MKTISGRVHELASGSAKARELGYYQIEIGDVLMAIDEWQASVEERIALVVAIQTGHGNARMEERLCRLQGLLPQTGPGWPPPPETSKELAVIAGDEPWNHWCASPCGVDGCEGSGNRETGESEQ